MAPDCPSCGDGFPTERGVRVRLVTLCPGCHRRADHGRVSGAELRHRVALG